MYIIFNFSCWMVEAVCSLSFPNELDGKTCRYNKNIPRSCIFQI